MKLCWYCFKAIKDDELTIQIPIKNGHRNCCKKCWKSQGFPMLILGSST